MGMRKKLYVIILILAAAAFIIPNEYAYAGNATRLLGFSVRDSAMAGATTASSEDTSCLVKNPAGLVRVGNRIDAECENILPHDVSAHLEGPNVAALGNIPFVNAGLRQKSTIHYIPAGNAGISYRVPGTDKYPVSLGVGAFTMSGLAVNYPSSRLNTALSGDYDKMVDLKSVRIAPGIAVAFNENLSVGATANIGIQALRSNLATTSLVNNRYTETAGTGNWDFAPGAGFTLGLLYRLNEILALGASYESHGWFGHHHKYKDTLWYIDEPPVVNAGLSVKPIKNLELTYDARYINWTDIKIARIRPNEGGFGWQDQWVFATGGEYTTFKDKLKLRLGYNYGKSPIQSHVVFANVLTGVIMEHHLTAGFSYFITKSLSLDFSWEHHFKAVKSENGEGDVYSVYGQGTKITAAAEVIGIGLGYKF